MSATDVWVSIICLGLYVPHRVDVTCGKDFAAAYNVALCMVNLGYKRDAATWFEESLRRDPTNTKRDDILARIPGLRK